MLVAARPPAIDRSDPAPPGEVEMQRAHSHDTRSAAVFYVAIALCLMGCPSTPGQVIAPCPGGADQCACDPSTACPEGRACVNNLCLPSTQTSISIRANDARSCEVLLVGMSGPSPAFEFSAGVRGRVARRGERVGLAFYSESDSALPTIPVRLTSVTAQPSVSSVHCFDRQGIELHDVSGSVR